MGYSEERDGVLRGACAPRPSHCANKCEDYVENFIVVPANMKTWGRKHTYRQMDIATYILNWPSD